MTSLAWTETTNDQQHVGIGLVQQSLCDRRQNSMAEHSQQKQTCSCKR